MPARRFPPPWLTAELEACFVVIDGARLRLFTRTSSVGAQQPSCSPRTRREDRGKHRQAAGERLSLLDFDCAGGGSPAVLASISQVAEVRID